MLVFFLNSWSSIPLEWSSGEHILQWMNSLIQYIKLLFKYFFFNPYTNTSYFFQRICFCSNFVVQISCKIAFHFFWKWYQIGFYILAFNGQKCSKLAFVFATILPEIFKKFFKNVYVLIYWSFFWKYFHSQ